MNTLTHSDIKTSLAEIYQSEYAELVSLQTLAGSLIRSDKAKAHKAIARRAVNQEYLLEGVKRSAEALGVSLDELKETERKERTGDALEH